MDLDRQAKITFVINASPCFMATLYLDKIEEQNIKGLLGFQAVMFKQALNAAIAHQGGSKSRSGGPKTGLERTTERQLHKKSGA
eukprot:5227019-Pyramimonas_sp.AAC.1